jgi:N-dimethylarginine dimethylaminohydrolase
MGTATAPANPYGGNSMVTPLRRVMICPPRRAGWSNQERARRWEELNFIQAPDAAAAQAEHDAMRRELEDAGAEIVSLPESYSFSLDAVYCHDPSLMTEFGAVVLRMGKPSRWAEPERHASFYKSQNIPILGQIEDPGTAEAGDLVWLDDHTLLAGRSYRTNQAGIDQLRSMLSFVDVEVIAAPLPHAAGPDSCLHLMSVMSMLNDHTILVDLPMLAVETVELLSDRHFGMIEVDPYERGTHACNVLALGNQRLLALEENVKTNAWLMQAGFDVRTFPGSALAIIGGGGPTCLTRPILRSA